MDEDRAVGGILVVEPALGNAGAGDALARNSAFAGLFVGWLVLLPFGPPALILIPVAIAPRVLPRRRS